MPNTYDLQGKTAIVTGGARGIGRAVVQLMMASGARVTVWDQLHADLPGARSELVDVSDAAAIETALLHTESPLEPELLVNCAGYLGTLHRYLGHPAEDWQRIVDVNLLGTLRVTQAVLPRMVAAGRGRIVNMGSLAGKEGLATLSAYSAASAGVIAFTKAVAREHAGDGIFINCVAPGPIDTGMIRSLGEAAVLAMVADSPMKRLGRPDEVAQLVAWLCSDASCFNTGAVFDISGGRARY